MLRYRDFFPSGGGSSQEPFKGINLSLGDALPIALLITDTEGQCVYSNPAYQRLCGWGSEALFGSYWSSVIHPQDHATAIRQWQKCSPENVPFECESRLKRADGKDIWTRRHVTVLHQGMPGHVYVHVVEDISPQKNSDSERIALESLHLDDKAREQVVLDFIGDSVLCTDTGERITYMNRAAESLIGFSRNEAIGLPLQRVYQVLESRTREPRDAPTRQAMDTGRAVGLENNAILVTRAGEELAIEDAAAPIHNQDNEVAGAVLVFHDTCFSAETAARMARLAQHDPLTGLLNRYGFAERFDQSRALAERHSMQMGILFIDLDDFKGINDAYGHAQGDKMLTALAGKLLSCVRETDSVCRFGGDEFVVLLNEIAQPEHAHAVADKIREASASLLSPDGTDASPRLSIGVSIYPDNGEDLATLLRFADSEMYLVKAKGKRFQKVRLPLSVIAAINQSRF